MPLIEPSPIPALPDDWDARWLAAHRRIDQAGYGEAVAGAYRRAGPTLAGLAGAEAAVRLGATVSELAFRCDRHTAAILPKTALEVARTWKDATAVISWLEVVGSLAKVAPIVVSALLANNQTLLGLLDLDGLLAFVRMGIAVYRRNPERGEAFFRLADSEARQFLNKQEGANGYLAYEAQLKPYLSALWGMRPAMREAPADAPEIMKRRAGFNAGGIRLPPTYAGFQADDIKRLYLASLAHMGAHVRYTKEPFEAGSLKPLQLAVISVIEDARVERLAIAAMPGLLKLWLPFHVARPGGAPLAITLLARLSRALIDPDYIDTDGWVQKGKTQFEKGMLDDCYDQSLSRRIGGVLGNDLGQMRLQFDAKNYLVQPSYRDDNLGIWNFSEQSEAAIEMEAMIEAARVERQERDDGKPDAQDPEFDARDRVSVVAPELSANDGATVARYPEFDHVAGRDRPDWCTVREYPTHPGDADTIRRFEDASTELSNRLAALIRSSKISRAERIRRQAEGEFLDLDACIEATISRRIGETPEFRVHGRYERRNRDLSVLILLDVSASTADRVKGTANTVLDVERLSTALLGQTVSGLGDTFAIAAFCSDTREDVRYFRIKDFGAPYDNGARGRLAGLSSGFSTRLGAAMRHAAGDLIQQQSYRRLLLVVTDGEPSDIDVDDERYLVEDARVAVHAMNHNGIDAFCVALNSGAKSYATRIFGLRGSLSMASVEELPIRLPVLFYRLTR